MERKEQLAYFDRKAEQMYARCLRSFKDRKQEILEEARRRLDEGFDTYGAVGFGWSYERLHDAELEEFADAINYRLMKVWQGWR